MRFGRIPLLCCSALALMLAQDQPPPPAGGPPPGGPGGHRMMPAPKNLKVLKIPPSELMPTMRSFAVGLGVRCDFCHVQGDFASDEKPQKEFARMMIRMAQQINANFPDGKTHVTCYTCHRGATEPLTAPAPNAAPPAGAEAPGGPAPGSAPGGPPANGPTPPSGPPTPR